MAAFVLVQLIRTDEIQTAETFLLPKGEGKAREAFGGVPILRRYQLKAVRPTAQKPSAQRGRLMLIEHL